MLKQLAIAALIGALTAWLGFAPIGWWWVPYITFAILAALIHRAPTVKRGALIGFAFGLAYFIVGVGWVHISMNEFGGMPLPMAWFAAVLFCGYLAIYPMLACAFTAWTNPKSSFFFAFVFACSWAFTEYLRAHLFTGFEWLTLGSSTVSDMALKAPLVLGGPFFAAFLIVFVASYLRRIKPLLRWLNNSTKYNRTPLWKKAITLGVLSLVLFGWVKDLSRDALSSPIGQPVRVSLLQGNIEQSLKWDPKRFEATLATYEKLIREAKGELIILPETAIPNLLHRVPTEYIERLQTIAKEKNANLLIGVPIEEKDRYYNAAISLGVEPPQQYRKVHLVPFGEYMPLQGVLGWFYRNFQIPMSNFAAGDADQPLMKLNGQTLGISICYEDAFARDVHRTLPDATLLVNISNDAWFGKSAAAEQHLQLAQMRAIEQARPMVRANNTGVTAVIDAKGRVTHRIDSFQVGTLEATVQGAKGYTPYMVWGDLPILIVCLAGLGIGAAQRLRRSRADALS
ncbi:MAG: apolipoprotein N-acyltransferase [Casimicrobium sp.]